MRKKRREKKIYGGRGQAVEDEKNVTRMMRT
jgi:hypothetical protein